MHDTCVVVGHIVDVDLCAIILPKVVFLAIFDIIEIDFYVFITIHPWCARGGIQAYAWAHVALSLSKTKRNITLQGCFITFIQLQNKYRLIKSVNSWPIQSIVVFTYICTFGADVELLCSASPSNMRRAPFFLDYIHIVSVSARLSRKVDTGVFHDLSNGFHNYCPLCWTCQWTWYGNTCKSLH